MNGDDWGNVAWDDQMASASLRIS